MNKEFTRMQQLAGLLAEVRIAPAGLPRFTMGVKGNFIYIDYHSPKFSFKLRGHSQTYMEDMVEPKNPNPMLIGIGLDEEMELILQDLISYLRSNGVKYNISRYEEDGVERETAEVYLSVSLDELKKKRLIREN